MTIPTFDHIIIGAGAAGCVLANRLSADPARRVALIEAGPSDLGFPLNLKTTLPIGNIFLLPHAQTNWQHEFSGGPGIGHRKIPCPRGKLFGGCTSVNGTVYIRGHRSDYDEWAASGNTGWGFDDVLPFFLKHEDYDRGASRWHQRGGELSVQRPAESNPLAHAFVAAGAEAGFARNDDFNGEQQDGFGIFDLNQRDGVRWSSSRAFLHPVLARKNLTVFAGALVERIRLRGSRAVGVRLRQQGGQPAVDLDARVEVTVCAGTVNSPQLLMLSGIGPADIAKQGVELLHERPGVGLNLQDHPTVSLAMTNPSAESYAMSWRTAPRVMMAPLRYLAGRRGMLASNAAEAGGFIRTQPGLDRPDVQYTFMVGMKDNPRTLPRRHGYFLHMAVLRPATRGRVELASADPAAKPVMHPEFLESRQDVDTLIRALREARRIAAMPALKRLSGAELLPGADVQDDAAMERFIRERVATTYHPVGTCKMGPASDPLAVVDPQLRVHGIEGLRVADASIMPNLIGGNTSAPSMMIGERAAHFILSGA